MREILTLQLGNLSNYAGTHFWNTQESYFTYGDKEESIVDHNIHWRPGKGADGSETFLPRTVIYDLKGGFGSLRKINALYDPGDDIVVDQVWNGRQVSHKQEALEQSAYQQSLDTGTEAPKLTTSNVRYWSDYSRVYYHPRSLVQVYDYELNSTIMPFERADMGSELFHSLNREHDLVDRDWRPFAEECDRMQGIQILATLDDAWGGFAASYVEALRDEFPKTCMWTWGLQHPVLKSPRHKRHLRLANTALSISKLCSHSSMVLPLSVPELRLPQHIQMDFNSSWQVSALLATAIETATLPTRLRSTNEAASASLDELYEQLNTAGDQYLVDTKVDIAPALPGSLVDLSRINSEVSPSKSPKKRVFGQITTPRGSVWSTGDEGVGNDQDNRPAPGSRPLVGNSVYRSYPVPLKFPLLDCFPDIFAGSEGSPNVDVRTTLSTNGGIQAKVKSLRTLATWSVGADEREALSNSLAEIGDAYQDDWSSGSDEYDDDA